MINNYGFNQYYPGTTGQWPTAYRRLYDTVGRQNGRRETALTEEQAEQYGRMMGYWLKRGAYYAHATNYPDDLCWVLACQDTLNAALSIQENN